MQIIPRTSHSGGGFIMASKCPEYGCDPQIMAKHLTLDMVPSPNIAQYS